MIALITLSDPGAGLAQKLAAELPDPEIFVRESVDPETPGKRFGKTAVLTQELFDRVEALVFIAPCGVAVRSIAPLCDSKLSDPAVVVVDVLGRYAVSLMGGHEGGANDLAVKIGNILSAEPIITTTTEALKDIVVGVGCRRGVAAEAVIEAVRAAVEKAGTDEGRVRYIASADIKSAENGLIQAAREMGIPLRFISSDEIRASARDFEHSNFVEEKVGLPGVAEPAALLAGWRTSLILSKMRHNGVAVAVARENSL